MKRIIVRCSRYSCYWNIGKEYRRNGNCAHKEINLRLDNDECSQYIERGEALARLAQTFEGSGK